MIRGQLNGMSTQKIRSRHENLQRENVKLARQLQQRDRQQQQQQQQRGPASGKRVYLVEEDPPVREIEYYPPIHLHSSFLLDKSTNQSSCR